MDNPELGKVRWRVFKSSRNYFCNFSVILKLFHNKTFLKNYFNGKVLLFPFALCHSVLPVLSLKMISSYNSGLYYLGTPQMTRDKFLKARGHRPAASPAIRVGGPRWPWTWAPSCGHPLGTGWRLGISGSLWLCLQHLREIQQGSVRLSSLQATGLTPSLKTAGSGLGLFLWPRFLSSGSHYRRRGSEGEAPLIP